MPRAEAIAPFSRVKPRPGPFREALPVPAAACAPEPQRLGERGMIGDPTKCRPSPMVSAKKTFGYNHPLWFPSRGPKAWVHSLIP